MADLGRTEKSGGATRSAWGDKRRLAVKSKLDLLRLAERLGSVTRACEALGYSRDSYYRFKTLYERGGVHALTDLSRRKPVFKNRVAAEVEAAVLTASLEHPEQGQQRIAELLAAAGYRISSSGVRSVWMRHGMETTEKRLFALLERSRWDQRPPSAEQQAALDRARARGLLRSGGFVTRPGQVCYHDSVHVGDHPRCGEIHLMTFIDSYSHFAFAALLPEQPDADEAAAFLRDRVLPWFEAHDLGVETVRTDRRPPFSGKGRKSYGGFLRDMEIAHLHRLSRGTSRADAGSNLIEELRREVFQPFFRGPDGRLEALEAALADWIVAHNEQKTRPGPCCFGRTPAATVAAVLS